jgi:GNAT superfamily N-acetyltransferase
MDIRDATPADSDALAALLAELGYPVFATAVTERLARFTSKGNGRVLVAVVDGGVRAFAAIETTYPIHHDKPVAHLSSFAVSQSMRRRGVGRQLLRAVEQTARDAGCGHVVVTSADHRGDAHAFYPSAGWGATGRKFGKRLDPPAKAVFEASLSHMSTVTAPGVMLTRLTGPLTALLARGIARSAEDGVIELMVNAQEAAEGGMVYISMRVPIQCPMCADVTSEACPRCGTQRTVEEPFSALLAVRPGTADGTVLHPSAVLKGMIRPVSFRVRLSGQKPTPGST